MKEAIRCEKVYKTYGSVKALNGADLSINYGEIRAILGGNGSGKSTLSKILGGTVRPDSGDIYLEGEKIHIHNPSEAKRYGIIVTSQELSLLPNLTVAENLLLCDLPKKRGFVDRDVLLEKAKRILGKIGLEQCLNRNIESLPANQKYMLEFAKAIIQEPKLLIIDEVTSALYRSDVETVKRLLDELKQKDTAILFISHRLPEIYQICETVTVFRNGETIDTLPAEQENEDELLMLMSGRKLPKRKADSIQNYTQEGTPLLSVENVPLESFSTKIKLQLYPGEIVGLAGLDGQGQSDIVRTLYALNTGIQLKINGEDIHIKNPNEAIKNGLAFISGDREKEGTFPNRSVTENLNTVKWLVQKKKRQTETDVLQKYGVKYGSAANKISSLSGGNQQKVVFARWMISDPKIIFADDPAKGIDVGARHDIHEYIIEMARQGTGVLYVSSDDAELVDLAGNYEKARVIIVYNGQFIHELVGSQISLENIAAYAIPRGDDIGEDE